MKRSFQVEVIAKMKQYGVRFFEIDNEMESEVEMDALPDDYISGLIKMLKDDLNSRERINRVYKRMADNIGNEFAQKVEEVFEDYEYIGDE